MHAEARLHEAAAACRVRFERGRDCQRKEKRRERRSRERSSTSTSARETSMHRKAKQKILSPSVRFLFYFFFFFSYFSYFSYLPIASLKTSPGTSATRSCAGREGALSWFPIEGREEQTRASSLSLVQAVLPARPRGATMSMHSGGHRGVVAIRRRTRMKELQEEQRGKKYERRNRLSLSVET